MYYTVVHQSPFTYIILDYKYIRPMFLYLDVTLHSKISWFPLINNIAVETNRTLNFQKHNFSSCSSAIKATAYLTIVHPVMEYVAAVI